MTVRNTGTTSAEADLLTPMMWAGADGKLDQTIGGFAAMNDYTTSHDSGTDLSLNSTLAPGQYETGYLNVGVINPELGAIVIPSTDANYNQVVPDTLLINYGGLPAKELQEANAS